MEINLDPGLWSNAPDDIFETILMLHLRSLSTSDLVQFRLLSRYWNYTILSSQFLSHQLQQSPQALKSVFCTYDDRFVMSLDTKTSTWFRISLDFLLKHDSQKRKTGLTEMHGIAQKVLESLQFLTTDGGLICFSTCNSGQIIVCNLITKLWKDVWLPSGVGREERPSETRCRRRWTISGHGNMDDFLVGLVVDTEKGEYKLVVTSTNENSEVETSTILYSSVSKSWKKIAATLPNPLLQGVQHYVEPVVKSRRDAALTCHGCIYFLLKYEQMHTVGIIWRLLKFDPESESWSILPLPWFRQHQWTWWQVSLQLLEHQGHLVLLESTSRRWFEFYLMEDLDSSKPIRWVRILDNLTREMGSFIWYFPPKKGGRAFTTCLRCVGQGKCLFFVEENSDEEPRDLRVLVTRCTSSSESASGTKVENVELWESDTEDFMNQSQCWMLQPSLTPVV